MPKRKHPEDDLQAACVTLLSVYEAQKRLTFFAVPNGGFRLVTEAKRFKRLGVRAGVPDICVLTFGRSTFLELKSEAGRLSEAQERWRDWLCEHGFGWALIRSIKDLEETLGKICMGVRA